MPRSDRLKRLMRLVRDARGASALEFALLAPLLIAFVVLMGVGGQYLTATRHVTNIASTLGNLATQTDKLHNSDVNDILSVGTVLISPMPADSLGLRFTSIKAVGTGTTFQAQVDWSEARGTLSALSPGSSISVPTGLLNTAGDSVILAEAVYTFIPPAAQGISGANLPISKSFYFKPRVSQVVTRVSP
jgi:Flp pilus assembly protein TadG